MKGETRKFLIVVFILTSLILASLPETNVQAQEEDNNFRQPSTITQTELSYLSPLETVINDNFVQFEPYYVFDGANYIYVTTFGNYTWVQPLNQFNFVYRNGTEIIKQAFFVLQYESYGSWLSLLDIIYPIEVEATNSTYHIFYQIEFGKGKNKQVVANISITMDFFEIKIPKIHVKLNKTLAWGDFVELQTFRWIWVLDTKWFFYEETELSATELVDLGNHNFTHVKESTRKKHSLLVTWEDFEQECLVQGGKASYWNTRGLVVIFPSNITDIDPSTVVDQESVKATQRSHQRKVFKNPRGTNAHYAMIYYKNDTESAYESRLYKSTDNGITWTQTPSAIAIKDYGSDVYDSSSLYYVEDSPNSQLLVFMVYGDTDGNLYYQRGTIADASSDIVLGTEVQLLVGDEENKAFRPVISFTDKVWVVYKRENIPSASEQLLVDNFTADWDDWTKVGSNPYLDAIDYSTHYVYTDGTGDQIGWFEYDDTASIDNPSSVILRIYCQQDGNDQIEPYIWNGISDYWLDEKTPPSSWGYLEWDITWAFSSSSQVNAFTMAMVKRTSQSRDSIEVDYSDIQVTWTTYNYEVRTRASKVANPTSIADFSGEYWLYGSATNEVLISAIANLPSNSPNNYEVLIGWLNDLIPTQMRYRAKEIKYNSGTDTFTEGTVDNYIMGDYGVSVYMLEQSNNVYGMYWDRDTGVDPEVGPFWSGKAVLLKWTNGSGWSLVDSFFELRYGASVVWGSGAPSLNRTASPNTFYWFYSRTNDTDIFYRTYTIGDADWSSASSEDETSLPQQISASLRDTDGRVQIIYVFSSGLVKFWEYPPTTIAYTVTFYFYTGGTLLVNGTNRDNGTSTDYDENIILNITGIANVGYQFKNHTYDANSTYDNPFYLTVIQDYTIWTYFNVSALSITFYFYTGGYLIVNGSQVTNGSSSNYNNGDVLNLTGVKNKTGWAPVWELKNFTWNTGDSSDNPYFYTVSTSDTIHSYFQADIAFAFAFYIMLGFISGLILLIVYVRRK